MAKTVKPRHEEEIELAKAKQLYSTIIDTLNAEDALPMAAKINVLAQVLKSIGVSVKDEESATVLFLQMLALMQCGEPKEWVTHH